MSFADILKNKSVENEELITDNENNIYEVDMTTDLDSINSYQSISKNSKRLNSKFYDMYSLVLFDYFQDIKEDMEQYNLFCYENKTKSNFNHYEFMLWLQKFIVFNKNDTKNIIPDFSDDEYSTEYTDDL